MPYIKGTQQEKLHHAKKMIARLLKVKHTDIDNPKLRIGTRNFLLRQSTEILDNPNKSYTQAPQTTSTAKNITLPDPSKYKTYLECTQDLDTNYHVDPKISSEFCKQVNPDNDTSGSSQIQTGLYFLLPTTTLQQQQQQLQQQSERVSVLFCCYAAMQLCRLSPKGEACQCGGVG